MPGKRKKRPARTKARLTTLARQKRPQKAAEDALIRRIYDNAAEADAAMCKYNLIEGHRIRRLYRVETKSNDRQDTFWMIAADAQEGDAIVIRHYLNCSYITYRGEQADGNPISKLNLQIDLLQVKVSEQRAMWKRLQQQNYGDASPKQFNNFLVALDIEVSINELLLSEKKVLVDELRTTPKLDLPYRYRNACDRIRTKISNYRAESIAACPSLASTVKSIEQIEGELDGVNGLESDRQGAGQAQ